MASLKPSLLSSLRWLTTFAVVALFNGAEALQSDPDVGLNAPEIIRRRGYDVEEHEVVTADRYVLTMHRIPKSFDETRSQQPAAPDKPVVCLMHGLFDSSFGWVANYRNQSFAFLLADAGYDVWLGNNRGNSWSRKHLDWELTDDEFWDFTWEDMGKYDLPAMLKYVLKTSGQQTLSFVGHSEGTMQAFAGFSLDQALAKKVSYFAALAPVAYTGHTTARVFVDLANTFADKWLETVGVEEFAASSSVVQQFFSRVGCVYASDTCHSLMQVIFGPSENINASRVQVYVAQTPAGTSMKNVAHFAQGIRDDSFRSFDYGCSCARALPLSLCPTAICENKRVYAAFDPPEFELGAIEYPRIAFFSGEDDIMATARDIDRLRAKLPKQTIVSDTIVAAFSHVDFVWGVNAHAKVYADVLAHLAQFHAQGYE